VQAVEEHDRLGRDAFLAQYGFHPARRYYLIVDGRRYDSKAIVGVAHGYAVPEQGPLRSEDFSGGHATVEALLTRLGFEMEVPDRPDEDWELLPGEQIRRVELHDRYGGGRQGGIAPSATTPNVLVFSAPDVGAQHGYYDRTVGSTLHYYGEGQRGDQTMDHGNRAILDHVDEGRALRVFEGATGTVTYKGEYTLDPAEPWYTDRAPETGGGPVRDVIVFKLLPVGAFHYGDTVVEADELGPDLRGTYRTADETVTTDDRQPFEVDPDRIDRGLRAHRRVQNALADWVTGRNLEPVSPGIGDPEFDVGWWDNDIVFVAEVKSLTATNENGQLRLGLGQVLDYADQIRRHGHRVQAVLAVEREPSDGRWVALCESVGVTLTWPPDWPLPS
jgi:hypothetical protein